MNRKFIHSALIALFALTVSASLAVSVEAQNRPYRVSDRQVQSLLDRIESRTNTFRREIDRTLDNRPVDGTRREDSINEMVGEFETATDRLRDSFASRTSTSAEVEDVLNRAAGVNRLMLNARMSRAAETTWNLIRADLNTLAGYYRVTANWNASTFPTGRNTYYVTDTQVRSLLARIETRTNNFQRQVDRDLDRGQRDGTYSEDSLNQLIADFETSTDTLRNNFSGRRSTAADVQDVLGRAVMVDRIMRDNQMSRASENSWTQIRTDLDTLAGYYRVASNWNSTGFPNAPVGGFDSRMTGTYRLNVGQSDNIQNVVDRAIANNTGNDRRRRNLERRLTAPATLAIEKIGQQVTMSSPNGSSIVLTADGTSRSETSPNGRNVRTSVTATNRDLTINYEGDRTNDFRVTFMPVGNDQLRVTRLLYLENQNQTVTSTSVYDKTSQMPDWNTAGSPPSTGGPVGEFFVPNNTGIVATLDTPLSTKTARDGERFAMTVTSPSQYRDAVIEGRVNGEQSGVVSGRANMSLSFDTIRLRNGQTYRFAGIVDQVRQPNGDTVSVNNEGSIREGSQTTKTVTRAGLGAALGAILGAVIGGGQGAAIGAGVGAGAGAGTVILQGRDNLELATGSTFTITATAPANVGSR